MIYPFKVYFTEVDEHKFWIAESLSLKGCVGQGDSPEEALSELAQNEGEWIETAKELKMEIPLVPIEPVAEYSGKLTLRMAPFVHQQAAKIAKSQGISLNQYVNDAIVYHNGMFNTINTFSEAASQLRETITKTIVDSFEPQNRDNALTRYSVTKGRRKKEPFIINMQH